MKYGTRDDWPMMHLVEDSPRQWGGEVSVRDEVRSRGIVGYGTPRSGRVTVREEYDDFGECTRRSGSILDVLEVGSTASPATSSDLLTALVLAEENNTPGALFPSPSVYGGDRSRSGKMLLQEPFSCPQMDIAPVRSPVSASKGNFQTRYVGSSGLRPFKRPT
eukprot:CAMPEP_0184684746 /NCGR_PEP_ID=MMETSP0312-20130426/16564_1 /TAXON_ID=31354 /ORGANISM="Compsopogon coeruleus, Strain SAG 36.94" /LENGTH=162 /DNA_ID=CAMNT_0027138259 /DNA_START=191 /DNA_END=679 /DNA_ORIENTATION=+